MDCTNGVSDDENRVLERLGARTIRWEPLYGTHRPPIILEASEEYIVSAFPQMMHAFPRTQETR